ncbi:MAG TPA: PhoU domain-containing protein, partial [Polyangiaceae bacterium LLY-WYZ-15_(1-7)]|nr:PhoU domain-containing protein [Polyangiaceae bacterium LLY-WYZ-15_(1-7)]
MKNGGHDEVSVQRLKDRLLSMGGRCERMLATAMRALVEGERALVEQVFADEDRTNGDELAIDELAL